jgi:hypothetical protein
MGLEFASIAIFDMVFSYGNRKAYSPKVEKPLRRGAIELLALYS